MDYVFFSVSLIVAFLLFVGILWFIGREKRKGEESKPFSLPTKTIKIDEMTFVIRKINVLDHLEGAKVLSEIFSVYKNSKEKSTLNSLDVSNINKLKSYLTDIICAGCVKPKFTRDDIAKNESEIPIKDLFSDWLLSQKLAQEIFEHTHGKKN